MHETFDFESTGRSRWPLADTPLQHGAAGGHSRKSRFMKGAAGGHSRTYRSKQGAAGGHSRTYRSKQGAASGHSRTYRSIYNDLEHTS